MEASARVFQSSMERRQLHRWKRTLTVYLLAMIICVDVIGAKSAQNVHRIPASANPGYIVKTLYPRTNHVARIEDGAASGLFFINGDHLSTKKVMTHRVGQRLDIGVKHMAQDGDPWIERILVDVRDSEMANQFTHQPYVGFVAENEPAGVPVSGLEEMLGDVAKFSYGCRFSLSGPDSVFLKLGRSSVVTTIPFDYEQRSLLRVVIEANCAGQHEAATLTVQILNVNDNPPKFERPVYLTAWRPSQSGRDVLQVVARDADGDDVNYSLSDSSAFQIDPGTGMITAHRGAEILLQSSSTELEAYAGDGEHMTTVIVQVITQPLEHDRSTATVLRHKRSLRDTIKVVVRYSDSGSLFRVASIPPNPDERFQFSDPAPAGRKHMLTSGSGWCGCMVWSGCCDRWLPSHGWRQNPVM